MTQCCNHFVSIRYIRFETLAGRPGEEIEEMLPALIHESSYGSLAYILDPAADQPKSLTDKVLDIRREIELTVKPRLYRVLIG